MSADKGLLEIRDDFMYAIIFSFDVEKLSKNYHQSNWQKAYSDIENFLQNYGFYKQQDLIYFGEQNEVTAVTCVTVIQKLSNQYEWFEPSLKDIQMLRIEEWNDLMPAIKSNFQKKRKSAKLKIIA